MCHMQMPEISMFILIFSDCWGKKCSAPSFEIDGFLLTSTHVAVKLCQRLPWFAEANRKHISLS